MLAESRAAEPILPLALFRNRTFAVTSGIGFIIGLALFGAVTYLPLYMQIVKGRSATESGLLLTPMMAGVLITSIGSGNLISKTGRYKPFPIIGTAVAALGDAPALPAHRLDAAVAGRRCTCSCSGSAWGW